ncbi:hypothetical protein F751_0346 [Auxenochlorella protothecoides]|uniref:HIG1 domain-containing protein n=1 Tax=Auxenochlorella protothecoides TaxID=3075 RepID=A0A087SB84_AUXPR|nr:hypothetical protein F751_0346 [Auxenochlorella protothecoides]KFM22988.1 hypothetical protein F751_0346 [Auxenochlorella protothecoides]RMZ57436.1 hypothetical protein APUTEX25_004270 [Auxenochlorella protothecoides]|eukprot:RMZ57436.1 hypothetical protein APUTEX25_004270 [Auxenochlorella protothecoides]
MTEAASAPVAGVFDRSLDWIVANKLRAYQWTRPIPTSLKIIHSRVYAQAITLGALAAVAGIETYHRSDSAETEDKA